MPTPPTINCVGEPLAFTAEDEEGGEEENDGGDDDGDGFDSETFAPRRYLFHSSTLRASVPIPTGLVAPESPPPAVKDNLCLLVGIGTS